MPCGFVCSCPQTSVAIYDPICNLLSNLKSKRSSYAFNSIEKQYFTGKFLSSLKFSDLYDRIYSAYQFVNSNNACPLDFSQIGSNCYALINDGLYDWTRAQSRCSLLNSELASFNDQSELDMIRAWLNGMTFVRKNIWTDGRLINNQWVWNNNNSTISLSLLQNLNEESDVDALDLSFSSGFMLTNDERVDTRLNYVLCKTSRFEFNNKTVRLNLIDEVTAITATGAKIIGYTYEINVNENSDFTRVIQPTVQNYSKIYLSNPIENVKFYTGTAYPYTSPFVVTLCNQLTGSQIHQVQQYVYNYWTYIMPEYLTCNCFNLYITNADFYIDTRNTTSTMISFIAKVNDSILDSQTIYDPKLKASEIYAILASNGYSQCFPKIASSATLQLTSPSFIYISSSTVVSSINKIRPDLVGQVQVAPLFESDHININTNKIVSVRSFDVKIGGKSIDFLKQKEIDLNRLIDQLNYQNPDLFINLPNGGIYSRNYFFVLFSLQEINQNKYQETIYLIQGIFRNEYPQFSRVSVTIPLQEEYIDTEKNSLFGLSVMLTINEELAFDVININLTIFDHVQSMNSSFSFFKPKSLVYPLSESIVFFSNMAITQNNIPKFEMSIKKVLTETESSYSGQSILLAKQKPYIAKNGTVFWKLFIIIPNIEKTENNFILKEDNSVFVNKLKSSINFVHPSQNLYEFFTSIKSLYDISMHFSVVIEGLVAEYDLDLIRNSIVEAWKLAVQKDSELSNEWTNRSQIVFIDNYKELVNEKNNLYYTQLLYFITQNNNLVLQSPEELVSILPNYQVIQSIIQSNNITYILVDPNNSDIIDDSSYFHIDLLGTIDLNGYNQIQNIITNVFAQYYLSKFDFIFVGF